MHCEESHIQKASHLCIISISQANKINNMKTTTSDRSKQLTEKITLFICFVLRHKPESIGIDMCDQAWVSVDSLLSKLKNTPNEITLDELKHIVDTDTELRYSFKDNYQYIRCEQGHSVDFVNVVYDRYYPNSNLYHGTSEKNAKSILCEGIKAKKRNYAHLSMAVSKAHRVGKRHSKNKEPVILVVDKDAPIEFFISLNGVILTKCVPSEHISRYSD